MFRTVTRGIGHITAFAADHVIKVVQMVICASFKWTIGTGHTYVFSRLQRENGLRIRTTNCTPVGVVIPDRLFPCVIKDIIVIHPVIQTLGFIVTFEPLYRGAPFVLGEEPCQMNNLAVSIIYAHNYPRSVTCVQCSLSVH